MKLIWTKSTLPLSVFIRWGLKEPVSHFAIIFDNKIVFHSNLLGCHIEWFNKFEKSCDIVYSVDTNLGLEVEERIYQSIINKNIDKSYDFGAFFYFIWRAFLLRCLKKPMPTVNKWAKDKQFICTGLAAELPIKYFPQLSEITDTEMTSPYQLYLKLSGTK